MQLQRVLAGRALAQIGQRIARRGAREDRAQLRVGHVRWAQFAGAALQHRARVEGVVEALERDPLVTILAGALRLDVHVTVLEMKTDHGFTFVDDEAALFGEHEKGPPGVASIRDEDPAQPVVTRALAHEDDPVADHAKFSRLENGAASSHRTQHVTQRHPRARLGVVQR